MSGADASRPLVSVVMATHRRPEALERALEAIRAQALDDLEIVVVDDASGDSTPDVLRRVAAREPRLRWRTLERNLGAAGARNRAIEAARGRYLAIMDDDDVSEPHRLRVQAELLERRPDVGLVAAPVRWVDLDGRELAIFPGVLAAGALPESSEEVFRLLYLEGNKLPNPALMLRASVLDQSLEPFYPEDLRTGEDWLAVLRLLARGVGVAGLDEPLVRMQRGDGHDSLMSDKAAAFRDQREVLARIRALDPPCVDARDHRRALARQRAREARWWGGWRGLRLALAALATDPLDARPREAVAHAGSLAVRKVLRSARRRTSRR